MQKENDIKQIKSIIATTAERYRIKGGDVRFAGIEDGEYGQDCAGRVLLALTYYEDSPGPGPAGTITI